MPFDCALDGPRLVLRPSDLRSYPVIGEREERQISACAAPGSSECRVLVAHRFAISCGGRSVPWMRIVAAARRAATRDMWVEGGRIHLAVERRTGAPARCAGGSEKAHLRPGQASEGSRLGLPLAECLPWQRDRRMAHVALPPGFAPVGEIGAQILVSTGGEGHSTLSAAQHPAAPPKIEVAALPDRFEPVMALPAAESAPRIEKANIIAAEQQSDLATIPAILTGADSARTWITLVRPEAMVDPSALLRGPTMLMWSAAMLLAALLAGGAWARWRGERAPSGGMRSGGAEAGLGAAFWTRSSRPARRAAPPSTETSVTNAAASVTALIEQANGSLDVLRGAPPLREVLEHELGVIRQRLAIVRAQASEGPESAHKAAPAFRSLVRDLERVRRISESAAMSFSGGRVKGKLPRTRSEAYDVLGVHGDVSEQTLKKLVDALRMCWHPDLARDEVDRGIREERIKCINVAWELISGKRAVA